MSDNQTAVNIPEIQKQAGNDDRGSSSSTRLEGPSLHVLEGRRERHHLCLDLLQASVEGDSSKARSLILQSPENIGLLSEAITERQDTVLHVATGAKQTLFVQDMINLMRENNSWTLNLRNKKGNTAFCIAAMAGSVEIAEAMLQEDRDLLRIRGAGDWPPLYLAALFGQKDMAEYLYKEMKEHFQDELTVRERQAIFFISIDTTLYDLALKLLNDDQENELAMADFTLDGKTLPAPTPLHRLAQTPLHLLDQSSKSDKTALSGQALILIEGLWNKILENKGAQVWNYFNKEQKDILFDAARLGNFKFLDKLIRLYPDLVHLKDEKDRTIFHIAIMHRHENLFNLIHKTGFSKQLIASYIDEDGNSLLHLAATYPERRPYEDGNSLSHVAATYPRRPVRTVPGAALEMQRESRIFKDVELLVMPSLRQSKNKKGQTPRELFTTTHADLLETGEKWMRDTASQCMLVGTLIATVVFAAAFTMPGGTKEDNGTPTHNEDEAGIPIHLRNIVFRIFAMADAIALSSSSISILMFLSILTSRYAENDFHRSLPLKLMFGILGLSISIASMMLAFISSFFLAYSHHRSNAIPIISTVFVFLPVFVFVLSQYSLLRDILRSSYRSRFSSSQ